MTEPVLVRAFASEVRQTAEGMLEARLAPYNTPTRVTDMTPDGLDTFVEELAPSLFAAQVAATSPDTFRRITFRDGHDAIDGSGKLGWSVGLRSEPDALYGTFKIMPSRIPDVVDMLASGIRDVSIGFLPLPRGTIVRADGSRLRTRGQLYHVALEPAGAYPGAEVLAMRSAADEAADEAAAAATAAQEAEELAAWLAAEEQKQAELRERLTT